MLPTSMSDSENKNCMIVRYGSRALPEAQQIASMFKGPSVLVPDANLPEEKADFQCFAPDSAEWLAVKPA
jgi:hypothetical protein